MVNDDLEAAILIALSAGKARRHGKLELSTRDSTTLLETEIEQRRKASSLRAGLSSCGQSRVAVEGILIAQSQVLKIMGRFEQTVDLE